MHKDKLPPNTAAIILAAGLGTRMKSPLAKVMHEIAGRPMVHYPVRAALEAGASEVVVVVGHGKDRVMDHLARAFGDRVKTAVQAEQRGTGDAARAGLGAVSPRAEIVLVYYGDVPLLQPQDLVPVGAALSNGVELALATCELENPFGYGRIVRDTRGAVIEIREQRDLKSDAERALREINPGIYAVRVSVLGGALAQLTPNNAQGEYYLTDIVKLIAGAEKKVATVRAHPDVLEGINDRHQLACAEKKMNARIVETHRKRGATIRDGAWIEDGVEIGEDATVEMGVVLRGETKIAKSARIDVGSVLTNVQIGEGVLVKPYSVLSDSSVGARAQIGPFSHLRPESSIGEEAHVGNFVETKKTTMAKGSKANHLAYLGDGVIGAGANIGAGTIFCNYDGFQKHTTTIEEGAFIGSDSQLVAPVTVGKNAYVGTGTTVTKDVPENALALSRSPQVNREGYAEKLRARFRAAKAAKK